jgi:catechol 2,3-dioxygenase-like lactoylglutathione lyase family enzyme
MENNDIMFRYIVNDVNNSISFYRDHLGFEVQMHPAPGFAILRKGNLKLLLNQPAVGGAGQKMSDGTTPAPGGWNRIQLPVENLESIYRDLQKKGLEFRNEIIEGMGGKQALLKDPSGNLIELFESTRAGNKQSPSKSQ